MDIDATGAWIDAASAGARRVSTSRARGSRPDCSIFRAGSTHLMLVERPSIPLPCLWLRGMAGRPTLAAAVRNEGQPAASTMMSLIPGRPLTSARHRAGKRVGAATSPALNGGSTQTCPQLVIRRRRGCMGGSIWPPARPCWRGVARTAPPDSAEGGLSLM